MAGAYKAGKPNATGRTVSRPKYILIEAGVFASVRFQSLSPNAVALYLEFKHRFNGRNNGDLHMSVREAAKVLLSGKDQAAKALRELTDAKFIEVCAKGRKYKGNPATTWYLCEYPKGKPVQPRVSYDRRNIQMFAELIRSPEYQTLRPVARVLLLHLFAGKTSHEARTDGVIMSVTMAAGAMGCTRTTAQKALKAIEAAGIITPEFRGLISTTTAIGTSWIIADNALERSHNKANLKETKQGQKKNPRTISGYTPSAKPEKPVPELGTPKCPNPQFTVPVLGTLIIPKGTDHVSTGGTDDTDKPARKGGKHG